VTIGPGVVVADPCRIELGTGPGPKKGVIPEPEGVSPDEEVHRLDSLDGVTVAVVAATVAVLTTELTVVSRMTVVGVGLIGTTVTKTVVTPAAHVPFTPLVPDVRNISPTEKSSGAGRTTYLSGNPAVGDSRPRAVKAPSSIVVRILGTRWMLAAPAGC